MFGLQKISSHLLRFGVEGKFVHFSNMTDVFAAKKALRKEMKEKISAISKEDKIAQSRSVTEKVLKDPDYIQAK